MVTSFCCSEIPLTPECYSGIPIRLIQLMCRDDFVIGRLLLGSIWCFDSHSMVGSRGSFCFQWTGNDSPTHHKGLQLMVKHCHLSFQIFMVIVENGSCIRSVWRFILYIGLAQIGATLLLFSVRCLLQVFWRYPLGVGYFWKPSIC